MFTEGHENWLSPYRSTWLVLHHLTAAHWKSCILLKYTAEITPTPVTNEVGVNAEPVISDVVRLLLSFRLEAPATVYLSADFPVHDFSIRVWLRCGTKGSLGRIVAQSFGGGVIMKGTPFGVSLSFRAVHPT